MLIERGFMCVTSTVNVFEFNQLNVYILLLHVATVSSIPLIQHETPIVVSLLTAVLKGVARSKASVDFKLTFSSWYSNIGYFVQGIPENVLNYFTRSGDTFTLKPLENRLSSGKENNVQFLQTL